MPSPAVAPVPLDPDPVAVVVHCPPARLAELLDAVEAMDAHAALCDPRPPPGLSVSVEGLERAACGTVDGETARSGHRSRCGSWTCACAARATWPGGIPDNV